MFQTAKVIVDEIFIDDSNYMTIQRSKGKEFESVLVNGEPFSKEKDFAQVSRVLDKPIIISDTKNEDELTLEEYNNTRKDGHKNNHHAYICCGYSQAGRAACSPHRTVESIFSDRILGDIREKARLISINEEAVIAEIKRKKQADNTSEQKTLDKNLQTLRQRLSELERLISKLYEEMVLGDIPREMVLEMMEKYKADRCKVTQDLQDRSMRSWAGDRKHCPKMVLQRQV